MSSSRCSTRPRRCRACSRRSPTGYRPLVVDNGSTDGSAEVARALGARVVQRAAARLRRGVLRRVCMAADSELVCFMDCDGSLDPRELPRGDGARRWPAALDLCLGLASAGRPRRLAVARAARQPRCSRSSCAGARGRRCATSARCARRGASRCSRSTLQDRAFGWPLEMVLRADAAGWRIGEVPVALPATRRRNVEGQRQRPRHAGERRGTWARCCDERAAAEARTARGAAARPFRPGSGEPAARAVADLAARAACWHRRS